MLTKITIATALIATSAFVGTAQAETKHISLNQFVDSMMQQTVVLAKQDVAYSVQSDIVKTTYNFNLDGQPTIRTNVEMVDLAMVNYDVESKTKTFATDKKVTTDAE
ncbi:MAG: hypothetical protein ABWW63_04410 [Glaciecola sp.]|jgi:hypothetical protein